MTLGRAVSRSNPLLLKLESYRQADVYGLLGRLAGTRRQQVLGLTTCEVKVDLAIGGKAGGVNGVAAVMIAVRFVTIFPQFLSVLPRGAVNIGRLCVGGCSDVFAFLETRKQVLKKETLATKCSLQLAHAGPSSPFKGDWEYRRQV